MKTSRLTPVDLSPSNVREGAEARLRSALYITGNRILALTDPGMVAFIHLHLVHALRTNLSAVATPVENNAYRRVKGLLLPDSFSA